MTVRSDDDVYFDPYDVDLIADPYPMYRRLREEAPLYYNAQHDFYALSRYPDVNRGVVDHETVSSAGGAILEVIKANIDIAANISNAVLFFASDESRYVTGVQLPVDAGSLLK